MVNIKKMTESQIISRLKGMNTNNAKYIIENIFVFDSEMDLFVQKPNDYIVEYKVKCSIEDFKKDFKKDKHDLMRKCYFENKIPNKFYFVCPDNLIPLEMIPSYAGLIYINEDGSFEVIKKPKLLHKTKANPLFIRKLAHNLSCKLIFNKIT